MMMRGLFGLSIAWALAMTVAAGDEDQDRRLIAAAAGQLGAAQVTTGGGSGVSESTATPAAPAHTEALSAEEQRARLDVVLAQIRLELVQARKASRVEQYAAAAQHAQRVLALIRELPKSIDADDYELVAEGILARAARHGVTVAEAAPRSPAVVNGAAPAIETDRPPARYQAMVSDAYRGDEVRELVRVEETRLTPSGDVAYPYGWPDRVERRARSGGAIARSQSWIGPDGKEWYAAVYDTRQLTYVPPDFSLAFGLDPAEEARTVADREALRQRSQIFGGYAEDLAAGIPLLQFFGGVDDFALRGPKYSAERQAELIQLIEAFTTQQSEAKVIPLGP
jgi:hypothetical protein